MSEENNKLMEPELVREVLENQKRDMALREKELDLEKAKIQAAQKSDERQLTYAQQQLAAMERDRKDAREYGKLLAAKGFLLYIILIIAVTIFLIFAMWKDKDGLVLEIIKTLGIGGSFGFGGYAWGYKKGREKDEKGDVP